MSNVNYQSPLATAPPVIEKVFLGLPPSTSSFAGREPSAPGKLPPATKARRALLDPEIVLSVPNSPWSAPTALFTLLYHLRSQGAELEVPSVCVQLTSTHFHGSALCASKNKNKVVDGNQRLEMFLSRSGNTKKNR